MLETAGTLFETESSLRKVDWGEESSEMTDPCSMFDRY